uniref:Uncharacterized protein n=1 Tax=Anguilla anguilla TaxID=7936 RepID=A0A0E9VA32_ANGAN
MQQAACGSKGFTENAGRAHLND